MDITDLAAAVERLGAAFQAMTEEFETTRRELAAARRDQATLTNRLEQAVGHADTLSRDLRELRDHP